MHPAFQAVRFGLSSILLELFLRAHFKAQQENSCQQIAFRRCQPISWCENVRFLPDGHVAVNFFVSTVIIFIMDPFTGFTLPPRPQPPEKNCEEGKEKEGEMGEWPLWEAVRQNYEKEG